MCEVCRVLKRIMQRGMTLMFIRNKVIYHIFRSPMLWFVRDDDNGHHKIAEEHLKRCDVLLEECNTTLDALEERLANTPKPSEVLDWYSVW